MRHQVLISHYVHHIFFHLSAIGERIMYKRISKQLRRKFIDSPEIYSQFKTLNTNKICIIPALVNKKTNSVARSDADKAYLLAKTFAEPPKDVDEKHYEMIEEDIKFKVAISKPLELDESCIWSFDIHQGDITKEEVIEALRHLSPYKAQGLITFTIKCLRMVAMQ
ncbi:hypothetical protein RFI_39533 [Reticulomyxa filosa]|uniref:Uncharacterized protein n=1 Tax=Reticulomyxa filosa TaxID=46433 RepID=X6LB89_RETFI|nr:hypothetical protein RFI_39533 [Reticulomyxa filosa]|eukprot:ETN97989.1 hypothetical protein RFI_39533 [Reticulomyxa filosa]